ncbi:MAG: efflux RND transporter periplasmic adaptor subunit [Planctomycetota bacterium]|nr:efflux RND transporter periplasmic adaptor subunit [Planctomycetota bacterium]
MSAATESSYSASVVRPVDTSWNALQDCADATWLARLRTRLSRRWLVATLLGLAACAAIGVSVAAMHGGVTADDPKLVYFTAQRGSLEITVTERGNLESQQNIEVICEIDDLPGDGVPGTPIASIVPNGSKVKQGDLLVELEGSQHRERLDLEILDTERARATQLQAQAKYDNQLTQNVTAIAEAKLKVKLTELDLEMFRDEANGTQKLAVQEIERMIDDVNNEILAARASMELKKNEKYGIESLFKLGYAGKSELDRSRLEFLQAEGQYAAKMNRLKTELARLAKKQTYECQMSLLQLDGGLATAQRRLLQVERDNEALLAQAKAVLSAANQSLKKEEERLARYQVQVDKCKIYAPSDGMVAYAVSPNPYVREEIREGAAVRPRQPLLCLPNLKKMQVKTSVHESVLDQIRSGLTATIRIDAFPDRTYQGTVKSVAVMPEQGGWMSGDTKVYETIVTVPEDVDQLRPGMTAVVEIHVDNLQDVLTVPVQAVVQVEKQCWCYVDVHGTLERLPVQLGRTNDKFVDVQEGLQAGDRVVLNPMAVADELNPPEAKTPTDASAAERVAYKSPKL